MPIAVAKGRAVMATPPEAGQAVDRRGSAPVPEQHSLPRSLALHLLPGVFVAAIFYGTAPFVMRAGWPAMAAGLLAAVIGVVGLQLWILLRKGRSLTGRWSIAAALPWRPGKFTGKKALLVVGLLVWQLGVAIVMGSLKPPIVDTFFSWMPDWAITPIPPDIAQVASPGVLLATAAGMILINSIAGPLVEELYFRGYLLPRIGRFGLLAPLLNIALFSLYHFWTPWDFALRIVLLLPMAYATWRTRDIRIAIIAHCGINTLGFVLNSGPTLLGG